MVTPSSPNRVARESSLLSHHAVFFEGVAIEPAIAAGATRDVLGVGVAPFVVVEVHDQAERSYAAHLGP